MSVEKPLAGARQPAANVAVQWAAVLIDEMLRAGIERLVIAPGSRSTPLVLAAARRPELRLYSLLDERGAAFFALGLALRDGKPAALLCTSGTAAANFFPAVVEASHALVPMLILTADRPPELRGSGANQTIDQVHLFGGFVRFFRDMHVPIRDASPSLLRYLRSTIDRAVAAALSPAPGPVHLNLPFRKPLEPDPGDPEPDPSLHARSEGRPLTSVRPALPELALPRIEWPARTLILAGPRGPSGAFPEAVADLSRLTGFPIVADALSGLRFGPWTGTIEPLNPQVCRMFRTGGAARPDLILQFGSEPVSQPALEMLRSRPVDSLRVMVGSYGAWHDGAHTLSHRVQADPAAFCRRLAHDLAGRAVDEPWARGLRAHEARYWSAVQAAAVFFEGRVLEEVVRSLPDDSRLFVSNSLPVRHLDEWARPSSRRIRVFCNRGASGIDGTISTALGVAAAGDRPLALVLGDLSFYHDLNGLLALRRFGLHPTIVLINNDGGGIFHRLPVAAHDPPFTDLFRTPHGLDFEPAAALFGASYERIDGRRALQEALRRSLGRREAHIIEVRTDSGRHEQIRRQIIRSFENSR